MLRIDMLVATVLSGAWCLYQIMNGHLHCLLSWCPNFVFETVLSIFGDPHAAVLSAKAASISPASSSGEAAPVSTLMMRNAAASWVHLSQSSYLHQECMDCEDRTLCSAVRWVRACFILSVPSVRTACQIRNCTRSATPVNAFLCVLLVQAIRVLQLLLGMCIVEATSPFCPLTHLSEVCQQALLDSAIASGCPSPRGVL